MPIIVVDLVPLELLIVGGHGAVVEPVVELFRHLRADELLPDQRLVSLRGVFLWECLSLECFSWGW